MRYLWRMDGVKTRVRFQKPETPYISPEGGGEHPFRIGRRRFLKNFGKNGIFMECGYDKCVPDALGNPQEFDLVDVDPDPDMIKSECQPYIAVAGWIEEWYHITEIERKDKTGTFKTRVRCEGHGCKYCKNDDLRVFGKKFYTTFTIDQWWAVFRPLDNRAHTIDRTGHDLLLYDYRCRECEELLVDFLGSCPQCGEETVSVDIEAEEAMCDECQFTWSIHPDENPNILEAIDQDMKCPSCGHVAMPKPCYEFADESVAGEPDPCDLFDIQIAMHKGDDKKIVIDGWDVADPNPKLFDPKFQGGDEAGEKIAERNKVPLDLDELLQADPPAVQAKILGKRNPFDSGGDNRTRRYQRPKTEEDDE